VLTAGFEFDCCWFSISNFGNSGDFGNLVDLAISGGHTFSHHPVTRFSPHSPDLTTAGRITLKAATS
jgi:hypothetical protein